MYTEWGPRRIVGSCQGRENRSGWYYRPSPGANWGDYYGVKDIAYPTFNESRFMAYDVIAHGARGILYWGSHYLKSNAFRESIYALTSELAALQPFLVTPDVKGVQVNLIEILKKNLVVSKPLFAGLEMNGL